MKTFATVDDLSAVWSGYDPADESRATTMLGMVSSAIGALCDASSVDVDVLRFVTCQATARAMQAGDAGQGVSQESWTASPFGGSVTYANPSGDVYLTSFERRLLGIDEPSAGFYAPGAGL